MVITYPLTYKSWLNQVTHDPKWPLLTSSHTRTGSGNTGSTMVITYPLTYKNWINQVTHDPTWPLLTHSRKRTGLTR